MAASTKEKKGQEYIAYAEPIIDLDEMDVITNINKITLTRRAGNSYDKDINTSLEIIFKNNGKTRRILCPLNKIHHNVSSLYVLFKEGKTMDKIKQRLECGDIIEGGCTINSYKSKEHENIRFISVIERYTNIAHVMQFNETYEMVDKETIDRINNKSGLIKIRRKNDRKLITERMVSDIPTMTRKGTITYFLVELPTKNTSFDLDKYITVHDNKLIFDGYSVTLPHYDKNIIKSFRKLLGLKRTQHTF